MPREYFLKTLQNALFDLFKDHTKHTFGRNPFQSISFLNHTGLQRTETNCISQRTSCFRGRWHQFPQTTHGHVEVNFRRGVLPCPWASINPYFQQQRKKQKQPRQRHKISISLYRIFSTTELKRGTCQSWVYLSWGWNWESFPNGLHAEEQGLEILSMMAPARDRMLLALSFLGGHTVPWWLLPPGQSQKHL